MLLQKICSKEWKNGLLKKSGSSYFGLVIARQSKLWEPDYLILGQTKPQEYDDINVQIKSYDFAVLENYKKLIIKIANIMNIKVAKTWSAPQQDLLVTNTKKDSTASFYKYMLKLSERNIQVIDVKGHIMPLFIEAVVTSCPPGVNISIHEHEAHMEQNRYIPNLEVKVLQEELEKFGSVHKKKKN